MTDTAYSIKQASQYVSINLEARFSSLTVTSVQSFSSSLVNNCHRLTYNVHCTLLGSNVPCPYRSFKRNQHRMINLLNQYDMFIFTISGAVMAKFMLFVPLNKQ